MPPQQFPDPVREPAALDEHGGLAADRRHPPRGDRDPGKLAEQQRRPVNGHVMADDQVRGLRVRLRPEAGARPHVRGHLALGDLPAARAGLRLRHVLRDPRRGSGRNVGDLVTALRGGRLAAEGLPAAAALRGREEQTLVRVAGQPHSGAGLAGLLPRRPLPLLPQRPVLRLLPERAVRGRRPRRREGIPAGLLFQRVHPGRELRDQPVRLREPLSQHGMRQGSKLLRSRQAGLIRHSTQPCHQPARQPPETANRNYPVTSNNTLTLAE